jgi:putative DNA primase/helicase
VFFVGSVADGDGRRVFDPAIDIHALLASAAKVPDVRLLIVDPIVNAVGGDGHKSNDVRRDLAPIVELASVLDCAALGISHFSKGTAGRDPVERVTGSLAFGALARVVLAAAKIKEDDDTERRILARAKSNIGPDGGGFDYSLEQTPVRGHQDLLASRVTWGGAIEGTARELLAEADAQPDGDGESPADIEAFVCGCLADGPVAAKIMQQDANGAGYSWDKVKRAANRIGVDKRKDGMRGGWVWALSRAEGSKGSKQNCLPSSHSLQHSVPPSGVGDDDAEAV